MPIYSEIEIDAPAERVWSILVDFEAYPRWNRFTPRITLRNADFAVGAEFELDCQMTDTSLLRGEREQILSIEPARYRFTMGTSRRHGRPGIRSCRVQECVPLGPNRCRLVNYEEFEGPLAPIVRLLYAKKLGVAFRKFCASVKARAEDRSIASAAP